ncbi:phage tail tape measure protein [Martelella mediterranea]|uniref:TP901 family phage tail tape measure protein n=1 Tax=Martelella mediterranea TaxID=293089 RepID=A0A4R3NZQ3_9HYPH|nr:phage tail tape measure protein [Martelella mediterranea]TCT41139.1 TP901 family phage tail tape measure protein [Martelella mediterranea]
MDASLVIRLVDKFNGPAQRLREGFKRVADGASRMKKNVGGAIATRFSVDNLEAATQKAEANLQKARQRLLGAAAMGAIIVSPIMMAADFSAQMANVSTLIDTSVESMDAMKSKVLEIAARTPVKLNDLTGALYDVRSAGISAADQFRVLEGSARLGVAGLGSTKSAVDLVTSSINAFNLEGEEQNRIYDVIFKTVKNGKTTIDGLAQGFGDVAGTVANAGIGVDEYLASVAAMTTTGMKAAQVHTQIRAAISGLTKDTKETRSVFKELGAKNFKDLVDQSGGMVQAFSRIRDALGGNDAALQKLLGSQEAYNAVIGLTGSQNEVFTSTLDDMRNGANAVDEAYRKQSEEFTAQFAMLKNQLSAMAITIGNVLLPVVLEIVQEVRPLIDQVLAWTQANPELTRTIVMAVAGLLAFNIATRLASFAVAGLRMPLLGLTGAFLKFDKSGKNVASGWRLIAGAGRMLAGSFGLLGTLGSGLVTVLAGISAPVWAVGAAIAAAALLVWKYWDHVSSFLSGFFGPLKDLLGGALDFVGGKIDWLLDKFSAITGIDTSGAKQAVRDFFDFSGIIDGAKELLDGAFAWLKGLFKQEKLTDEEKANYENAGREIGEKIANGIKAGAAFIWEWLTNWPALIREKIGTIDLSGVFKKPAWLDRLLGGGGDDDEPPAEPANDNGASSAYADIGPPIGQPSTADEKSWLGKSWDWMTGAGDELEQSASRSGKAVEDGGKAAGNAMQDAASAITAAAGELRTATANARASGGGLSSAQSGTFYDGDD